MPDPKDKLEVKKYPRDVREVVEWCRARLMRPTEIKYGDEVEPRWEQGDNKEVIVLPIRPRGSAGILPFTLKKASTVSGGVTTSKVRVYASTILLHTPTGFSEGDTPHYVLTVTGVGYIWGGITLNTTTGVVTSCFLDKGATVPATVLSTGSFFFPIGTYAVSGSTLTVSNLRYGPISGVVFRTWFNPTVLFDISLS